MADEAADLLCRSVYFIGAGGIGMSALIRYFLSKGKRVAGYDRTPSDLTTALIREGARIHFNDQIERIPEAFRNPEHTLVVYTPAVPSTLMELAWFRNHGFEIVKRSEALGRITRPLRSLCVAGTHGKTTTSSMIAHILKQSHLDCSAFLGGILKNYKSNLLLAEHGDLCVVEADEYDRSFHRLRPYMAVITAADPDHLDIYGTPEAYREAFAHFSSLIRSGGCLLMKEGLPLTPRLAPGVACYSYGLEAGDFHAENVRIGNGEIRFDFVAPDGRLNDVLLGVPVTVNIENGVAAMAIARLNGATDEELRSGMASFRGAERRFDIRLKTEHFVLIDDYAHHPKELRASILSVKELYAGRHLTGIFQPHLYSRTRDFAEAFAEALSLLDRLILLDIYPAREEPIPGVSSRIIFDRVTIADKTLCRKEDLLREMAGRQYEVVLMLGAGDIDRLVEPVKKLLEGK
ncbi:MAG: UDP-N-acetylmuramate--L-alanine ligase [Tannerella sp.]|nr:UDP-N-acetylmuramate--L-alanine ligase [Tannerella sp.]